jgi:hypothetical protein
MEGIRRTSNAISKPEREHAQQRSRQSDARGSDRRWHGTAVATWRAGPPGANASSVIGEAAGTGTASSLSSSSKSDETAGHVEGPHFPVRPMPGARLPGSRAAIEHPRSTGAECEVSTAANVKLHGHASMAARQRAMAWTEPPERPTFGSLCHTRLHEWTLRLPILRFPSQKVHRIFADPCFSSTIRKDLACQLFGKVRRFSAEPLTVAGGGDRISRSVQPRQPKSHPPRGRAPCFALMPRSPLIFATD